MVSNIENKAPQKGMLFLYEKDPYAGVSCRERVFHFLKTKGSFVFFFNRFTVFAQYFWYDFFFRSIFQYCKMIPMTFWTYDLIHIWHILNSFKFVSGRQRSCYSFSLLFRSNLFDIAVPRCRPISRYTDTLRISYPS